MPELPEVEMAARYFARHALGQKIARVRVLDERVLGAIRKETLARRLTGRSFRSVRRHGKHLFAEVAPVIPSRADGEGSPPRLKGIPRSARDDSATQDVWLHMHFGMTGDLAYYRDRSDAPRFARVIFDFDNGAHLAFEDMRLFGVVDLTAPPDDYIRARRLGPDPLTLRLRDFRRLLAKRRGTVKALLMAQDVIAGIGNLYADEALFRASIDPRRPVDRLTPEEVTALFGALKRVLDETISFKSRNADYPRRFLVMHREEGDRCPRCGGIIRRAVVAGRTTYYCANHQV